MQDDKHGPQEPEIAVNPDTHYTPADDSYDYYGDSSASESAAAPSAAVAVPAPPQETKTAPPARTATGGGGPKTPAPPSGGGGDEGGGDDEDGMLRMSFLEHLEELRSRILKALAGVGVAFVFSLFFQDNLWLAVSDPAVTALRSLGFQDKLVFITPMEAFMTLWVKLPMLASVFLASPWILYQVWAFISPGLYRRERRWAVPFIMSSAGLFITGGLFGYFIAFRYGLTFLLGIGKNINVQPMVTVTEYFDLFVNVMLGIGLTFELPILIFFLTLLRIASPSFLLRHSRYAILIITIIAAIVTPTPDVFNLMLFAVPMCLLFFVGIFAGYLLTLHRENRSFPWMKVLKWALPILALIAAVAYFLLPRFGFHFLTHWPFISR